MKYSLHKRSGMTILCEMMFALLPLTLLINTFLFRDFRVFGIGVLNFFYDIVMLLAFFNSFIFKKRYGDVKYVRIILLVLIITLLMKFFSFSGDLDKFFTWVQQRQYYFLIPLCYILLSDKKINTHKLAKIVVYETLFICPFSIYMFLTTEYLGMASTIDLLKYDVVGTPFARMFSIFGSPLVAGPFFALVLILIIYEFSLKRLFFKALFVVNALCLVLTFSRAAFIAFFAMLLYFFLFNRNFSGVKKIISIVAATIFIVFVIVFSTDNGFYFWQLNDILNNIRIVKWVSGFSQILKFWAIGSNFEINVSSFNTWESTISDNSYLVFLSDFGIIMGIFVAIVLIKRYIKMNTEKRTKVNPIILFGLILLFLYDFIQVFPGNFLLLLAYKLVCCSTVAKKEKKEVS